MFKKLIKGENGTVTKKLLATLLVITLTFANFALLGTCMLESIAIENTLGEQNTNTNNEYVKFNVYLDPNDTSVREVSKDINSEDLDLYVSVSVTGKGSLEKGSIDFSNSNFKSKENEEIFKRDIETISSQKGITVKLPIVAKKDSSYNLSLLNMISKIKLTGEYVDENGNITNIDSTKEVKINWTTQGITQEQIKVSQEIITNKIYEKDGENKRVLQLLIKTNVEDNKVPVKSTKIEIGNPIANVIPEEVKVSTYSTAATNGGSSIEFNNNQGSSWNYNAEENKTYIELTNVAEGNVSWQKNATDELIVTYIYDEQVNIESVSSDVKVFVVVYGDENTIIEQTNNLTLEAVEEKGNIVDIKSSVTKGIYKGYMYIGEETTYKTQYDMYVSYATENGIYVIDSGDTADSENLSTYYKSTLINKAQAINVLGNNGTIKIYNGENLQDPITEISLSQENSEDYITFNYSENVNNIVIVTSNPVKEGKIEIVNEKAIKVKTLEKIEEATKLDIATNLYVKDSEGKEIEKSYKQEVANLLEPTTSVDLELNKTSISNQVEEELTLTAILNTNNNSNKLFDNPTINIELPKEIAEATLLQDVSLLYEDELSIKSSDIITNENGNKVISIVLEGTQTKYDASANVVMYLKVKANEFMPDKEVEIKTTCINGEENIEKLNKISVISRKGILSRNSIQVGENKIEAINNNVTIEITENSEIKLKSNIINNYGEKITNTTLMGNIPVGTNLKTALQTNLDNASIYYATKENPTVEEWIDVIEDYTTVKAFKIEIGELEQANGIEIEYVLNTIEETLQEKDSFNTEVKLNYVIENQTVEEELLYTVINNAKNSEENVEQTENVVLEINPRTTTNTLHEGQIITYQIKAKNVSMQDMNNLKLRYLIPEGAVLTELTYMQATEVTYMDDENATAKEWNLDTIKVGETITREVTIRIKEGAQEIANKVIIEDEQYQVLAELETDLIKVNDGDLTVRLSRRDNITTTLSSGSSIKYIVIVTNNTESTINNLEVTGIIPEQTTWKINSEYNEGWSYNDTTKQAKLIVDELLPGETKDIWFEVEISKLENEVEALIESTAIVKTSNQTQYETNMLKNEVLNARWNISMTSAHSETLKEGEKVKYIITVKNTGKIGASVIVEDELPEEIQLRKLTYYTDENNKVEETITKNNIFVMYPVDVNETLTIEIEGIVYELDNAVESKQIKNIAQIDLGDGEILKSEEIINTILNDIKPGSGEGEKPDEPQKPTQKEETYSISGIAWLDENKNGVRDSQEKIMQAVKVMLLDNQGNIVKNIEGEEITTLTSISGTYKLNNVPKGEYIVAFEYDTEKYTVSKYQVAGAKEEQNSDVISKQITINNKTILVAATDVIKIENANIQNIDIGLIENAKFDLRLDKYVAKVIVTNEEESKTYQFNEATLGKVEIPAKQVNKTILLVQYEIKVTNEGEVVGYVGDIVDYTPKELEFNSEMNPQWYADSEGDLHNIELAKEALEPGKTKTVKLVLTKALNSNTLGTIENTAEIAKSSNLEGIQEKDSTIANKAAGEDDIGNASLIVSIKTGRGAMYVGIVIASILVLGIGIYLIDKKVLKANI